MKKNLKRGVIAAAGAATLLSLVVATPSFAHDAGKARGPKAGVSASFDSTDRAVKAAHAHASLAVTITGVSTDITDAAVAARGAKFVAYKLAADATAIPATVPTTGGKPVRVEGTSLAAGVLTGTLRIDAGAASTVTKYAIYNAAGVGSFVTVTVDAAGVATATTSTALTTVWAAPSTGDLGIKGGHKGEGKKSGKKGGRH
ncbi:MAG: hypothetical protein RJB56_982 [Actinomycetota bacterium]|jgi:hypothetical protein